MCRLLIVTLACLLVMFGASGLWMMPRLIQDKIEQTIQLRFNTKTYERFTRVPIPLTVKFYLFNITNAQQVLEGLERPQFREVGPFVYEQWRRRDVMDFVDHNRRIVYREVKTFYPKFSGPAAATPAPSGDPEAPNAHPGPYLDPSNFNVTTINLPLLSVLTKLAALEEGSLKRSLAAKVARRLLEDGRDQILVTRPANQLLFDGYKVDFMESARDLISDTLGFNFESPLPRNTFGFFYNKNGTWNRRESGEWTVFTGRNESMNDFMLVDNWNELRQLSVWPSNTPAGDRCNQIRGTDGSQFHPGVTRDTELAIFSPMICTSITIKYVQDTQVRDIPLLRFSTPSDLFGAPKRVAKNACYCTVQPPADEAASAGPSAPRAPAKQGPAPMAATGSHVAGGGRKSRINDSRCYLDGLMDLSLCQRGAPVAASSPHFYNGEPMLAAAAGLNPAKERHETYLDIEPMTGAVMRAASRAQLNAYVERAALEVLEPALIGHMTPMVAPMFWLEESAQIDHKSAREFKAKLLSQVQKGRSSFLWAIALGLLVAALVAVQYWYATCYSISAHRKPADRKPGPARRQGLGADARRSNLANKRNSRQDRLLAAYSEEQARQEQANQTDDDHDHDHDGHHLDKLAGAAGLLAAAAALGAAAAGPSRRPKPLRRVRRAPGDQLRLVGPPDHHEQPAAHSNAAEQASDDSSASPAGPNTATVSDAEAAAAPADGRQ